MTKKKCVSTCKQFEEPECNPPRCKYVKGQSRKYCRLSHNYKMNKTNCNVTRRIKKRDVAAVAKKRIGRLVKTSKHFLSIVCPNSGVCTAFGKNTDELTQFFKGFTNFNYAVSPVRRIGAVSNNGFVNEIEYEKQGYKAHAILKSSQNEKADNLVYEYLVGIKYINRKIKAFPCFVQTHGLYFYDSPENWKILKDNKHLEKSHLKHLTLQNNIGYVKACKESTYASLLIQHIQNAKSIEDMIKQSEFIKNDLLHVLFIVYHALSSLSKTFTHYDLHTGNVLLYKPAGGKYIQYHYHHSDGTETTFFSPYIPKIIDYGRSFFDNGNVKSKNIYDKICTINGCKPHCGSDYGFAWLDPEPYLTISSSKKNESHDLRLLNKLKKEILHVPDTESHIELDKILKRIVYGVGITEIKNKEYGTMEDLTISNTKIYNVKGAYASLKKAIENPEVVKENLMNFSSLKKIGDLHVYDNEEPMKYEEFKPNKV